MSPDELDEIFETYPTLGAVARFTRLIPKTPWFRHVGDPLDDVLYEDGKRYASALGFPEAEPAILAEWEDAAGAAESLDINSMAWEAEEQLRMSLLMEACTQVDEQALELVLTHLGAIAADAASQQAEEIRGFLQIHDDEFVRAVTGAAVQICHQAGLVLAAGGTAEHPFSLKFQIFEHGRWPIGITGASLNIF